MTPEQLAKLPKWAQEYITSLTREVDTWKGAALRFAKEQPEGPIYIEDFGQGPRQFVPATRLHILHAGVEATVFLTSLDDNQRMYGIEITYNEVEKVAFRGAVGIMPSSPGSFVLVHKNNMR